MNALRYCLPALFCLPLVVGAAQAAPEPGITLYHVGVDNAPVIGFGSYSGLSNPNYQRLTFLLSHTFVDTPTSNHFHRIGSYGYTGDPLAPTPAFSANDSLPEPYYGDDGLALLPGAGAFAGKLVSGLGASTFPSDPIEQEYGDLTIRPIDNLLQYDGLDGGTHPGHYLLNASGDAYKSSVAGVSVGMMLTSITPGLTIHDASGAPLFSGVGETLMLGPGADWSVLPVFAVDASAATGTPFEATFVLKDLSASPTLSDSAPFSFSFVSATAVPEPSTWLLAIAGLVGAAALRRTGARLA
ncbi:hypothetical protein Pla175_36430 [Pirellulimonas nuda]|uniref:Ice-binding protein C-terminal domain-containing protein n=1 Tax=Pirellulimonas nuda TaxID=2528009 RepID=A0A518DFI3_9BACT|nr:all3515 family Zur-repressed PEP-CTERM protein [Pirellulimonas nuda]QDU90241.1 hypothetical protein Pla175_36430 [Pirellulimonas nuda]